MAINAITAFNFSSSFKPIDLEFEEIKRKLMSLGKTPSGRKATDRAMLDVVLKEMELDKTNNISSKNTTEKTNADENKSPEYSNILYTFPPFLSY